MIKTMGTLLAAVFLAVPAAQAADQAAGSGQQAAAERIQQGLQAINPNLEVDDVQPTPLDGIYEVTIGAEVYYVSGDGRYMFQGELVDLQERRSLTEPRRAAARAELLGQVPEERMLVYPATGEAKHTVTVFTDIDCPYCRRFHRQMSAYNERGIEVQYLLMPRAGVDSESYDKAVSVWCADDSLSEMTRAKQGEDVGTRQCENPVKSHMELAQRMGVRATPTIVTEQGNVIRGYRSPEELASMLESESSGS